MKKLFFLALMLVGGMAAQAQDVLVGVYDTDKESVEDSAIKGSQTVETKTTIVAPAVESASVTQDDVMEVKAGQPLDKVEIKNKTTGDIIRTIDLGKTKEASVDLKPYGTTPITVIFYGENGETSEYAWE